MDIIKTIQDNQELWDLFTRQEEYHAQVRDRNDRFPYYASMNRTIFEPTVSKYLVEQGYHTEYPDNKPFAVCLSHDIDVINRSILEKMSEAPSKMRNAGFLACFHTLEQIRSRKIPLWNFPAMMALEERYGAKSSFYFMNQHPSDSDYNYNIEECEGIMGELFDGGWGVGLHGGHTAYLDPVKIKQDKKRLEKVLNKTVTGYRNHYLRFRIPDTWEHLSHAGFKYDTTLGYADCIGFRNGMCHPFRPYNLTTQREIDIIEIPLVIMDTTLDNYMAMNTATSWELTRRLIDTVERYHGVISVLWHNHNFYGEKQKFYEKILKYCAEKGAWMTSGEEIAGWFNRTH